MRIGKSIWKMYCPPHNINYNKVNKLYLGAILAYDCIPTT